MQVKQKIIDKGRSASSRDSCIVKLKCGHQFYIPIKHSDRFLIGELAGCSDCSGWQVEQEQESDVEDYSINPTELLNRAKVKALALNYSREFRAGR